MRKVVVRKDSYFDSVLLMRVSQTLKGEPGIQDAVVAMGTPHNISLLKDTGYDPGALAGISPNDLVIAVRGDDVAGIEARLDALLKVDTSSEVDEARPTSLARALESHPESNLVLVSVPGEHAAREARRALSLGRHVMIFSDNVSVEDEVALKQLAAEKDLLVMGPDCGTAIVNGRPLAFANVVRRGPIGVVGASGTGLQEITSCIHRLGGGVSQALGTGGRDLSEAVGGATTLPALKALAADPETRVLVVVSKPPAAAVAEKVVAALAETGKPSVVHFVGADPREPQGNVVFADTLAGAAEAACRLAGLDVAEAPAAPDAGQVQALAADLPSGATLCGLFCGGTTGHEALVLLGQAGLQVRSNLHKKGELRVEGTAPAKGHVLLDLGDDVFTQGRPHPMIEPVLRNERLAVELADPSVGLLLFDVVLGYGSHPDPAGLLAEAVREARRGGRKLLAIASITGTDADPQGFDAQRRALEDAGIVVTSDNRQAARLAAAVIGRNG